MTTDTPFVRAAEIVLAQLTPDEQHEVAQRIASNLGYELIAATNGEDRPDEWRVGNHYGIHVYAGNIPVATFHRAEDAKRCVEVVNKASIQYPCDPILLPSGRYMCPNKNNRIWIAGNKPDCAECAAAWERIESK